MQRKRPAPRLTDRQRWLLRELAPIGAAFVLLGLMAAYGFEFTWAWEEPAGPERTATGQRRLDSAAMPRRLAPAPPGALETTAPRPAAGSGLLIPVRGADPERLTNTFEAPRSAGAREHEAIDILAPRGTPVQAASDGAIARLHTSARGGHSIYQFSRDSSRIYYYAHLEAYADGLAEGAHVRRGDLLGFVGSTGNAPEGAPHLHFAIWAVEDTANIWDGPAINPYPLLTE